jgi:hypothetical protein
LLHNTASGTPILPTSCSTAAQARLWSRTPQIELAGDVHRDRAHALGVAARVGILRLHRLDQGGDDLPVERPLLFEHAAHVQEVAELVRHDLHQLAVAGGEVGLVVVVDERQHRGDLAAEIERAREELVGHVREDVAAPRIVGLVDRHASRRPARNGGRAHSPAPGPC